MRWQGKSKKQLEDSYRFGCIGMTGAALILIFLLLFS